MSHINIIQHDIILDERIMGRNYGKMVENLISLTTKIYQYDRPTQESKKGWSTQLICIKKINKWDWHGASVKTSLISLIMQIVWNEIQDFKNCQINSHTVAIPINQKQRSS